MKLSVLLCILGVNCSQVIVVYCKYAGRKYRRLLAVSSTSTEVIIYFLNLRLN